MGKKGFDRGFRPLLIGTSQCRVLFRGGFRVYESGVFKNYFEKYQPVWVSLSTVSAVFFVSRLTIIIARIAITNA
jgi:hypothetical protein